MKHLLILLFLALPALSQAVVGPVVSGTKLPSFWVIQSYGTTPRPGDLLDLKRDGWPAGQAKVTKVEGRLVLIRCTQGKLQAGDVAVPTGKSERLIPLDQVGAIPAGLEAPRQVVAAYTPRPPQRSKIAAMGGGKAPPTRASAVKVSRVMTAPHGVHNLNFERRTGQMPFAADSQGVAVKPGEVLNLGTYTDVEGNPLTAYWIVEERERLLGLKVDGALVVLDKQSWYRFKHALEESVERRQACTKGAPPVTVATMPGTNGAALEVQVISSTASDYGWTGLAVGSRLCRFTDRGHDNLGGLQRLLSEVGTFWKTE